MPRPEIAFDATPLQNAHRFRGIGTYVRGLASRLAAQKDVPIEFWSWEGEGSFAAPPPHTMRPMRRIPMPQYRGAWLFAKFAVRRHARGSSVRAIHITDPDALTPIAARRMLATVYDLIPLKEGVSRKRVIAWAGYRSYIRALVRADVIFAISEHTARDVVKLLAVAADRVVVAPPGIDMVRSNGTPTGTTERPYFLFLGGPNPNKNLGVLLEAFALTPELPEELRVGGRWLPKQVVALEETIRSRRLDGRVRHLGFVAVEELPSVVANATAVVVPSLDEGFGLPVGEGLAAGGVVIHSRIRVLEEVSAGAALTFDSRSPQELASCLREVSADAALRQRLRAQGRTRVAGLTWDRALQATLATYERVLQA